MSNIYLSETANPILAEYLRIQGHQIHWIRKNNCTYEPVCTHPDLYMCSLGPNRPVFSGTPENLGPAYPKNIIYNAACTGKFFIHNLNYTDAELLEEASLMKQIHVSQGYTKCNTVVVDENSIITSDLGIFKACYQKMQVLLITPGHVKLAGFPYGFLGGASGRIGENLVFNGNLEVHPDFEKIIGFIESRDLKPVYFTDYDLEDIGSIVEA